MDLVLMALNSMDLVTDFVLRPPFVCLRVLQSREKKKKGLVISDVLGG
jgi:hypothetical protein